jgi:hypothetical protein
MPKKNDRVEIPDDLSSLSDAELASFTEAVTSEFDALDAADDTDATALERMGELADAIDAARGETTARAEQAAAREQARQELRSRMHPAEPEDEEGGESVEDGEQSTDEPAQSAPAEPALVSSGRRKTDVRDVIKNPRERLNVRLSEASQHQPTSSKTVAVTEQFDASVLVASADIPGVTTGGRIDDMMGLVELYKRRGRSLSVTQALANGDPIYGRYTDLSSHAPLDRDGYNAFGVTGRTGDWRNAPKYPIASLQRDFRYKIDDHATPAQAWDIMQAAANPTALTAAGGWCSPSEIRYDFYNVVAMDGGIDLPTTGINRGGMRWPTSPSFGDLASSTGLWHWTETQDIAAATGTAQSGTKTCARVPCAAFNEARLEGEGVCITAGNLTTDAWPEQIANFLRLVNAAHFHRINSYFISNIIAGSSAVTLTQTNSSPTTDILGGIEHQVWDLRTKYAMADTDVLEVILPSWTLGLIRADLSRRMGFYSPDAAFNVTNAMIASWFSLRYVRVQFVQDFDVRGANQFGQSSALTSAWPSTVRFIIYPAGTWLRGNGLNLDLGIIRDSTLNATNDYTAAWSEEFFLLAKIGHESRIVTLGASANTPTGTASLGLTATGV